MVLPKVFVTRIIPDAGLKQVQASCQAEVWSNELPPTRDELMAHIRDVDGLLCLLTDRIDGEVMDAAGPQLKVISNHAVGYDNVAVAEATRRGIPVGITPGILTDATADFAFALLMAAARRVGVSFTGMKALVVDDNETARAILSEHLRAIGFRAHAAGSGEEAIAVLERSQAGRDPFALVLMDWRMPGMDGLEASRLIKGTPGIAATPTVIMATAYDTEEMHAAARAAGLEAVLVKPISQSTLYDAVMDVFGHTDRVNHAAAKGADIAEIVRPIRGARILLVEDNEMNQQVALELLGDAGLVVTLAADGSPSFAITDWTSSEIVIPGSLM